jgi:hypothetical protein
MTVSMALSLRKNVSEKPVHENKLRKEESQLRGCNFNLDCDYDRTHRNGGILKS